MPVSVGGPDLFFSYQKNGEKYSCYFCGGIFTKLWFRSPRCLFMGSAREMILGQADCQTQHDCCYILHLKLLMLRPNDNCQIKLLFLKFRLKSSNRLIKLLRFKREGMLSRCAMGNELAVTWLPTGGCGTLLGNVMFPLPVLILSNL